MMRERFFEMAVTISEVAEYCGVDVITVQHILDAGLETVPAEIIRAVTDAAKALGYVSRRQNLGVIYVEESNLGLTHPFFSHLLNAFRRRAEESGYNTVFIQCGENDTGADYLERCRACRLDGLAIVCGDFNSEAVKELVRSELPCITVDYMFRRVPAVLSDNETGVQKLVEYAIRRGHKKIAFVHGHNNSVVTKTRISQFINIMEYYKLPVPEGYLREGLYGNILETRRIVLEMLKMPDRPTCILLPDDLSYLGAMEAAKELCMRIPEDISFAGYDGIPLTQTLTPKLTTIHQNSEKIGIAAAGRLIDLIEHPASTSRLPIILPVELQEGGTIGRV